MNQLNLFKQLIENATDPVTAFKTANPYWSEQIIAKDYPELKASIKNAARIYNVSVFDIKSRSRIRRIVDARHLFIMKGAEFLKKKGMSDALIIETLANIVNRNRTTISLALYNTGPDKLEYQKTFAEMAGRW